MMKIAQLLWMRMSKYGVSKYRERKNKMRKNIKKYIPLDEDFMKRSMSDVLFAHIQINSYQDTNGVWFCYKPKDFFSSAKTTLGYGSVNTVKNKYKNLLVGGFIKEGVVVGVQGEKIEAIIIPFKQNFYESVDIEVLSLLAVATNERVIKTYAYLLNKKRIYKNGNYIFSFSELAEECLGVKDGKDKNNREIIKKILELLVRLELIDYRTIRQEGTYRKELLMVATKLPTKR